MADKAATEGGLAEGHHSLYQVAELHELYFSLTCDKGLAGPPKFSCGSLTPESSGVGGPGFDAGREVVGDLFVSNRGNCINATIESTLVNRFRNRLTGGCGQPLSHIHSQ